MPESRSSKNNSREDFWKISSRFTIVQLALRLKAQVNGGLHWVKIREFTKNGTYVKLTVKLFLVMFYDIHRGTTLIKGIIYVLLEIGWKKKETSELQTLVCTYIVLKRLICQLY